MVVSTMRYRSNHGPFAGHDANLYWQEDPNQTYGLLTTLGRGEEVLYHTFGFFGNIHTPRRNGPHHDLNRDVRDVIDDWL